MSANVCLIIPYAHDTRVCTRVHPRARRHQVARGYLGHEELTRAKFFSAPSDWPGWGGEGSGKERERKPRDVVAAVATGGAESFDDPTRWFRSGDLGQWVMVGRGGAEKEAMVEILGRKDLQVVCGCIGAVRSPGAPHATVACWWVSACDTLSCRSSCGDLG